MARPKKMPKPDSFDNEKLQRLIEAHAYLQILTNAFAPHEGQFNPRVVFDAKMFCEAAIADLCSEFARRFGEPKLKEFLENLPISMEAQEAQKEVSVESK